ncbi:dephospho-CoA kinase [bacterium]|jgi:dephospho-CoA kinase|nr:dephospho-CoA kinase [bacterium]MDG2006488.1 dephospho-CoA kinase [Thermodesulfobacteriota bacterium]
MKRQTLTTVGITGLMGSGKSTALNFYKGKGIQTYDLDIEAKKLLKKDTRCYQQIIKIFGNEILNANQTINRKRLRRIVFNNKKRREILNSIVHPELGNQISTLCNKLEKRGEKIIFLEGALITKQSKIGSSLNYIIYIDAPKKVLNLRILKRDGIEAKEAEKLLLMQKIIEKNRKYADFTIRNNSSVKEFNYQLNLVLDKLVY